MTRSASEPTAMVPLRGYRPKSFAGAVATSWTKRFGEKCLPWTPPVYTRLKRCSMPGPPLGILVKSSLPSSFCSLKQKGQWSVETTCSVSFARRRSEDVLRAFKARGVHILERKIQVLRTSFGVRGEAAVAGFADFFERLVAGEVNDVNGRSGHFREGDGARG